MTRRPMPPSHRELALALAALVRHADFCLTPRDNGLGEPSRFGPEVLVPADTWDELVRLALALAPPPRK